MSTLGQRFLVVIYGSRAAGTRAFAHQVAAILPDKVAVVSTNALIEAIIRPDPEPRLELDLIHVQLRLLVANYLKNGYSVVVEGAFLFERQGLLLNYEADIDQLLALMRHLTSRALTVRLRSSDEADSLIELAYRQRSSERYLEVAQAGPEAVAAIEDSLRFN